MARNTNQWGSKQDTCVLIIVNKHLRARANYAGQQKNFLENIWVLILNLAFIFLWHIKFWTYSESFFGVYKQLYANILAFVSKKAWRVTSGLRRPFPLVCAVGNAATLALAVIIALVASQLPTLHCTVIGFALDWESHKSLKHDRECLTELLERAFFQPHAIQRIQLTKVGWESDNKGFERKRGFGGLC